MDRENEAALTSELADEPEMLELVQMFVDELPQRAAAIEEAFGDADRETLARLAHQLKGAAGGYGFPTITAAALEVERLAETQREITDLQEQVGKLVSLCRRARATG